MTQKINQSNFSELVLKSEVPVILSFGAEWCGPCKTMQPVLESIAAEYQKRVIVGKVDVDLSPEISKQYNIWAIPTTLIIKEGQVVHSLKNVQPKHTLASLLDSLLP
jgi:thioredoxin 1